LADDKERIVPGGNHADEADRLTQNQAKSITAQLIVRVAVAMARKRRCILPMRDRSANFALDIRYWFSALKAFDPDKLLDPLLQELADLPYDPGALSSRF
jgi:hypothetical protein